MGDWTRNPLATAGNHSKTMSSSVDDANSSAFKNKTTVLSPGMSSCTLIEDHEHDSNIEKATAEISSNNNSAQLFQLDITQIPEKSLRPVSSGRFVWIAVSPDRLGISVAGQDVTGRVEIRSKKSHGVKIGKIRVGVFGMEEITFQKQLYRRTFLSSSIDLQNKHLPPSACVTGGAPDEHGMWPARTGVTHFDFSVPMTTAANTRQISPLPSSFWRRGVGGVRYLVCVTVEVKKGLLSETIVAACEIPCVVESYATVNEKGRFFVPTNSDSTKANTSVIEISANISSDAIAKNMRRMLQRDRLVVEKKFEIPRWWSRVRNDDMVGIIAEAHVKLKPAVSAEVQMEEENEAFWVAGDVGYVTITIRNNSMKKIDKLKIKLIRRVKTFASIDADLYASKNYIHHHVPPRQYDDQQESRLVPAHFSTKVVSEKTYTAAPRRPGAKKTLLAFQNAGAGWREGDCGGKDSRERGHNDCGVWSGIRGNECRKIITDINVPLHSRTIRNSILVEVKYLIEVTVYPANRPKLSIEVPITVLHPDSTKIETQSKNILSSPTTCLPVGETTEFRPNTVPVAPIHTTSPTGNESILDPLPIIIQNSINKPLHEIGERLQDDLEHTFICKKSHSYLQQRRYEDESGSIRTLDGDDASIFSLSSYSRRGDIGTARRTDSLRSVGGTGSTMQARNNITMARTKIIQSPSMGDLGGSRLGSTQLARRSTVLGSSVSSMSGVIPRSPLRAPLPLASESGSFRRRISPGTEMAAERVWDEDFMKGENLYGPTRAPPPIPRISNTKAVSTPAPIVLEAKPKNNTEHFDGADEHVDNNHKSENDGWLSKLDKRRTYLSESGDCQEEGYASLSMSFSNSRSDSGEVAVDVSSIIDDMFKDL